MISKNDKGYAACCFKQEQNRNKPRGNSYLNIIFKKHRQSLEYLLKICKAESGLGFAFKENPFEAEHEGAGIIIPFRLFYVKIPTEIDTGIDPNRLAQSVKEQFVSFTDDVRRELEKRGMKESAIRLAITKGAEQLCQIVSAPTENQKNSLERVQV